MSKTVGELLEGAEEVASSVLRLGTYPKTISGQLALPTQGSGGGILVGGDCHLYRVSANIFETPDNIQLAVAAKLRFRDDDTTISSKDAGHVDIDADISLDLNTPIVELDEYVGHAGDPDTFIRFRDNDIIDFEAGGVKFLGLIESGDDLAYWYVNTRTVSAAKHEFRDAAISMSSLDDGHLDIDADVSIDLNAPRVEIDEYIEHAGDVDTLLRFQTNDIELMAGNAVRFKCNMTGIHLFGGTPAAQPAHEADPTDLNSCIAAITSLIDKLKTLGILAADP